MFEAAGDPERLGLLLELACGAKTVNELAFAMGREPSLVSQQLRVLRLARLARGVRTGRHVRYELVDWRVQQLLELTLTHVRGNDR